MVAQGVFIGRLEGWIDPCPAELRDIASDDADRFLEATPMLGVAVELKEAVDEEGSSSPWL